MKEKTFLILGGYGNTGFALAWLLLRETAVNLVLAGRNFNKAYKAATVLNETFEENRVTGIQLDAANFNNLKRFFKSADVVIDASSTTQYTQTVISAALAANIDYLDIHLSSAKKLAVLKSNCFEIEKQGLCFITDCGFHPGLPAVLIRYIAQYFDTLQKANVAGLFRLDWNQLTLSKATVDDFVSEILNYRPLFFRNYRWQKALMRRMNDYPKIHFGEKFGWHYCTPMFLEEMRNIPVVFPEIEESGFFAAGFNWFVDGIVLPLAMLRQEIYPRGKHKWINALMDWGLKKFSKPPFGTVLKVEAAGEKDNHANEMELQLYHQDAYKFTAIPVTACLRQYLNGTIRKPGLWLMAHIVEPKELLDDMENMGIRVQKSHSIKFASSQMV